MLKMKRSIIPEEGIIRGLVLDSRDLFSRDSYEERIDKKLAELIKNYREKKNVDIKGVISVVDEFIKLVEVSLRELEDAKRKATQEEYKKLDKIRQLISEGKKMNSRKLKNELENFGKRLRSNTLSVLKYNRRREDRLKRKKSPQGFVMKKLANDKYLDAEVTKKAYKLGEDTSKEPKLFSEIDYLVNSLNDKPNEKMYTLLRSKIHGLIKSYEKDLDDFLTVEVDIGLEEARKLHRIDHYIIFLNMIKKMGNFDDLIQKLESLKKTASNWVYQDSINAKRLQQYAVKSFTYGEKLLEDSKTEPGQEFPGILVKNATAFFRVPGLILYNKNKPTPNRGIVLVHGAFGTKESLLTLAKRLASQDFIVFTIDLASHGENTSKFRLGVISEQILLAVRFLRSKGIKNVGVVGHSLGALCTLFAIGGYNSTIENQFFGISANILKLYGELEKNSKGIDKKNPLKSSQLYEKSSIILDQLSKEYIKLKKLILSGLRTAYESESKIDSAVMLAPPKTVQFFLPKYVSSVLKLVPSFLRQKTAKQLSNLFFYKKFNKDKEGFTIPDYVIEGIKEKGKARVMGGDVTNMRESFDYVQNVKNPFDFMEAIKEIAKKSYSRDKVPHYINYYINLIKKTPKLYIYSIGDIEILKSFIPRRLTEMGLNVGKLKITDLESHYRDFGGQIIRMGNVNHTLTVEGDLAVYDVARMPKITYKIVTFFNQHLGKGRL
jgi:esterase/lipase